MRVFIAIDVPEVIKEHLSFLQRSLDSPHIRFVHVKNIHLTLNFLGEQSDTSNIISLLHTIRFKSFSLTLGEMGFFPHEDDPSVLWVGLAPNSALTSLQRQIDEYFTPSKSFKAHLTIARCHKMSPEEKLSFVSLAKKLRVKPLKFSVKSFKLYSSILTPIGPIYEVLETFKADH